MTKRKLCQDSGYVYTLKCTCVFNKRKIIFENLQKKRYYLLQINTKNKNQLLVVKQKSEQKVPSCDTRLNSVNSLNGAVVPWSQY